MEFDEHKILMEFDEREVSMEFGEREILMDTTRVRLKNLSHQPPLDCCSIYRVPWLVRQLKEEAYTPRVVSIGPFHFGKQNLQPMEVHKTRYTRSLFQRTPKADLIHSRCVEAVLRVNERARHCYDGSLFDVNEELLAEILLFDGCFILEFLLRMTFSDDNFTSDPVFGNSWMINCLQRDLVLLENQIPFFVLESLFDIIFEFIPSYGRHFSLQQLCVFFHLPLNLNAKPIEERNGVKHLLDVVRNYYLPLYPKTTPHSYMTYESIHCATKLAESGIKFRKGRTDQLFDIKFCNGVLEIPLLLIQDSTESLLRNMIAFEQCCPGTSHHITSYVMLMDRIMDTPPDVEFLEQKRIITNNLGSGKDVSQLFSSMFKEVVLDDFYFEALCQQVNNYSNRAWPRYRAVFLRTYGNPWSILLLFAFSMVLVLTMVQTVFTVLSYNPPRQ